MPYRVPLASVVMAARSLARLPSYLGNPTSLPEARATLRRRLEHREDNFLANVKRSIFEHAASPYLQLFKVAGCEYGDLTSLVRLDGIEGALVALWQRGVYFTVNEFKGREPAKRGSTTIEVNPDLLRNPAAAFHIPVRTGGSRSGGTPVLMDLEFLRGCGVNSYLSLDARGGAEWVKSTWETPGAGARFRLLKFASFGKPPVRWFSQVDPSAPGLDPVIRWSERYMRWGSRAAGVPLPGPQYVPLNAPLPIAHWIQDELRAGRVPHVFTFPSSALRLCQAAVDAGIDLRGAQFTLAGEPITDARLATIRRSGATALPRYGSIECGPIAYGCLEPAASDDVHLQHDLHALVQPVEVNGTASGFPDNAVFVSSLHPRSPFTIVNVSMGDQATFSTRACGCPLERLGFVTHLHSIRSFEKLTGGGMTFLDTDVIRVLEEVMPARFGGAPTDYQLVEEEAGDGRPRLRLLVHPGIGPLNADDVADAFLKAIGSRSPSEQLMEIFWRDADLFRVERQVPISTSAGKIMHLHLAR